MRKKLIAIALCAGLSLFSLTACGSNAAQNVNFGNTVANTTSNSNAASNVNSNKNANEGTKLPSSINVQTASADDLLPYVPDGSYRGTAEGYNGYITVRVVVSNHAMTSIQVLEQNETEDRYESAEPILHKMVVSNTTEVDSVSGATETSRALKEATTDALRNAVS